jgi:hypothetical protein
MVKQKGFMGKQLHSKQRVQSWGHFGIAHATSDGMHSETPFCSFGWSHKHGWVPLVEWWAQRWSTSVCCLGLCRANLLVTVRNTSTILLLPLVFSSHAWPYAINCCTSITVKSHTWVHRPCGNAYEAHEHCDMRKCILPLHSNDVALSNVCSCEISHHTVS